MQVEVTVPITLVIEFEEHWVPSDSLEKTVGLARQRASRIVQDIVQARGNGSSYRLSSKATNEPKVVIVVQNSEE